MIYKCTCCEDKLHGQNAFITKIDMYSWGWKGCNKVFKKYFILVRLFWKNEIYGQSFNHFRRI
jgi:hypothetical protein